MLKLPGMLREGLIDAPEILVGGTPCQAFSVAGLRKGLADERGQLTIKYVEIADEIDKRRGKGNECVTVWENVPGVLSSKDNAFGCFLGALAGEDDELLPPRGRWTNAGIVHGPKRAIAWRILDAQYFGVAQRRRRVFVVASARDGFDPAAVLFESEGERRDTPPSRETGESVARGATTCFAGNHPSEIAATLQTTCNDYSRADSFNVIQHCAPISPAVSTGVPFSKTGNERVEEEALVYQSEVRRLTTVECARLQGFPDNHTQIAWRGKPAELCPDGPQYKAYGNSKAVPVIRWVGNRVLNELARCIVEEL